MFNNVAHQASNVRSTLSFNKRGGLAITKPGSIGDVPIEGGEEVPQPDTPSRRASISSHTHAAFDHISAIQKLASDKVAQSKVGGMVSNCETGAL